MSEWRPLALIVDDPTDEAGSGAPTATPGDTEPLSEATNATSQPSRRTRAGSPRNGASGSATGTSTSESEAGTSRTSVPQSATSTRHWPLPSNVRQFAAQARQVATMVLNDEIDLDKARTYSAVARTVAQAMTTEMVRARFLRSEPDMGFEDAEESDS